MIWHPSRIRSSTWILVFFISFAANAQELCGPHKATKDEASELVINEWEFTTKHALDSLDWLENDFLTIIKEHKSTEDLLNDTEAFGIPYPNSITFVRGAVLRLEAIAAQSNLEAAKLERKAGTITVTQLKYAKEDYAFKRKKFCNFLRKASYVD